MNLEEVIQRVNTIADTLLVQYAEDPTSRFLIALPPLVEGTTDVPIFDCQENRYCIALLREVLTYKYLLCAFKTKQLAVDRKSLGVCLHSLRCTPVIDYYDLGDYHEYAYRFYKENGNEKKARRHLLDCYMDRGRAILSAGKTFDCKELIMALMKDHKRMQGLLVYVLSFIHYDFEELQDLMKRSQYLLLERALILAVKLFAENPAFDKEVRSCVYYVQSHYYEKTNRADQAKEARTAYQKLGGKKNYDLALVNFMMSQPDANLCDERFLDYMLYRDSMEDSEIYPLDEAGYVVAEEEVEDPILDKNGRSNFMDTYYRPAPAVFDFMKCYELAETGDRNAIGEVARRFREGDGVTPCVGAAEVWAQKQ